AASQGVEDQVVLVGEFDRFLVIDADLAPGRVEHGGRGEEIGKGIFALGVVDGVVGVGGVDDQGRGGQGGEGRRHFVEVGGLDGAQGVGDDRHAVTRRGGADRIHVGRQRRCVGTGGLGQDGLVEAVLAGEGGRIGAGVGGVPVNALGDVDQAVGAVHD